MQLPGPRFLALSTANDLTPGAALRAVAPVRTIGASNAQPVTERGTLMSAIDDKYNSLKASGFDLGSAQGSEEGGEAGGRIRRYEKGHIYWSSGTGAHMGWGGILNLYLAHGGPGVNPATGGRELGYPTSDEEFVAGTNVPHSRFEWGAIYWAPGTGGCVLVGNWAQAGSNLGLPLSSRVDVAGGRAAYFEHGVVFSAGGVPGVDNFVVGHLRVPQFGRPVLVDPDGERGVGYMQWDEMTRDVYEALIAWRPNLFKELLQDRLWLASVADNPFKVPLVTGHVGESQSTQFRVRVIAQIEVAAGQPNLQNEMLYDVGWGLPNVTFFPASRHCLYVKKDWADFGLLHITDLHISGRNDAYRAQLQALGLTDAAAGYSNFQDNLRDFIRYANKLHSLGIVDAVVATGDLIDYVAEDEDPDGLDNYVRLRNLLLGTFRPGQEQLKIPFFATRGNHDYRLHPYTLRSNIDLPDVPFTGDNFIADSYDRGDNQHSAHNLTEREALALQGWHTPTFGVRDAEEGVKPLLIDPFDNKYHTFKTHFTQEGSYVVKLGKHRLVVLDTKHDAGIPPELSLANLVSLAIAKATADASYHPAMQKLLSGIGPDSIGFTAEELSMLQNAVVEAGSDGLVIAAMHCPPFHPHGDFPYYLRETIHPTADPALTEGYVRRTKISGATWPRTGTPHFKEGDLLDGMDAGFLTDCSQKVIEICAGIGLPRPVDLILYGHHHERVEHRVRHNAQTGQIEYFNDFYTENPVSYYATINDLEHPEIPLGGRIGIKIEAGAAANAAPRVIRSPSPNPGVPTISGRLSTPPYADPLSDSDNPRDWWARHRPVFAQTASLGPIDERQRFDIFWRLRDDKRFDCKRVTFEGDPPADIIPSGGVLEADEQQPYRDVSFSGFRLIEVAGGTIHKVRYIALRELRESDFKLPWEPAPGPFIDDGRLRRGGGGNVVLG